MGIEVTKGSSGYLAVGGVGIIDGLPSWFGVDIKADLCNDRRRNGTGDLWVH